MTSYRSFLTQTPSVGTIEAYTHCKIATITHQQYIYLMNDPFWLQQFKLIGDQLFIDKCKRQTNQSMLSAKERYLLLINEMPAVEQLFPQHLIASMLNIRPETLSRLKSLDIGQLKKMK